MGAPAAPSRPFHRILATKLVPPGLPSGPVPRPRLQRELTRGTERRLTLVSAQPGAGKTVLVAEWARSGEAPGPVGWVGLDQDDDLPGRLWTSVDIALDRAGTVDAGALPDLAGELGDPVAGWLGDAVERIVNKLAARTEPIVLVLDDFHELSSRAALGQVTHLVRHAPPQLRLVICTRADPPLPLQWLRLSGELTEIRAAALAFTPDEVRALLGEYGEELSEHAIELLCERTEGWAASVRLAALALAGEEDPDGFLERFAGDDRAVADYLLTEVLARQNGAGRKFLLRTSVPDRLTGDLAKALTGRADAEVVLTDLVSQNLLVSRHAGPDVFFGYHGLLLEFLRAELRRRRAAELPDLHRRAARWYGGQGEPMLALRHALAGEDWPFAASLVAQSWHTVVLADSGASARGLADRLAPEALANHAPLALLAATTLFAHGQAAEATRCLEQAERLLAAAPDPAVTAFLEFVRLAAARLTGDPVELAEHARTLLDAPPPTLAGSPHWFRAERAIGLAALGSAEFWAGEYDSAEEHLDSALQLARDEAIGLTVVECLGTLALREFATGRLRRAADVGRDAVEHAALRGISEAREVVNAYTALGSTFYHWDELAQAREQLERAASIARAAGDRTAQATATGVLSLTLAAVSPDGADQGLRLVRACLADANGWAPPPHLAVSLAGLPARLLAMKGDLDAATAALGRAIADHPSPLPSLELVRARILLLAGEPWEAAAVLDGVLARSDELPYFALQVEANLLDAIARRETHERERAAAALERTLELAAKGRFRRLFVGAGPVMRTMLVEQARRGTRQRAFVGELIATFDNRAGQVEQERVQLLEPLSAREQAILRYLPTLMSNQEIAGELFVSVNTVKTHLRSIYRKLDVARRRDAVETARRLELL